MTFDPQALIRQLWAQPTAAVDTPAALVEQGAPAQFRVRMATAEDIVVANEAFKRQETMQAMVEALMQAGSKDKAEALRAALGLDGEPPENYVRQIEFLIRCTEEPKVDREFALWLGRHFSLFFKALFEKIMELTGQGASLGKAPPSTGEPMS